MIVLFTVCADNNTVIIISHHISICHYFVNQMWSERVKLKEFSVSHIVYRVFKARSFSRDVNYKSYVTLRMRRKWNRRFWHSSLYFYKETLNDRIFWWYVLQELENVFFAWQIVLELLNFEPSTVRIL